MTSTADLKKRVETRKQELINTLRELRNSTADDAAATRDAIKKRLSELGQVLKEGVVKGWEDVGDIAKTRIERWLATEHAMDEVCEVCVLADRDRIHQALSNLVGNALVHARGTAVTLSVDQRDVGVAFIVADAGPGISAAALPHIFDRYWQGRDRHGGAGLGLAIAKGIVDAHGGSIAVTSLPGAGGRFEICLPLTR